MNMDGKMESSGTFHSDLKEALLANDKEGFNEALKLIKDPVHAEAFITFRNATFDFLIAGISAEKAEKLGCPKLVKYKVYSRYVEIMKRALL